MTDTACPIRSRGALGALSRAVLFVVGIAAPARATDFSQLPVTRIRIASVSAVPCPGAHPTPAPQCIRLGVVVLFRQASGTEASISTQYITTGTLAADIRRDFGPYAPVALRMARDALASARTSSDTRVADAATRALPTVDGERAYELSPGVDLPFDLERVLGAVADPYRRATGRPLSVVATADGSADIRDAAMTDADRQTLRDATNGVAGASLEGPVGGDASLWRIRFAPVRITLRVGAFIPGSIDGLTLSLTAGPHAGRTAIRGPAVLGPNSCFLTDQRSFDLSAAPKSRLRLVVELDLAMSSIVPRGNADRTTEVACDTGVERCSRVASAAGVEATNWSSETLDGGNRRYFVTLRGSGRNPCVNPSPDIDWVLQVIVLYERATGALRVAVDGLIEPFPAFEMVAQRGSGSPVAIFQYAPEAGSTPWSLPGPPTRAVTVVAQPIP